MRVPPACANKYLIEVLCIEFTFSCIEHKEFLTRSRSLPSQKQTRNQVVLFLASRETVLGRPESVMTHRALTKRQAVAPYPHVSGASVSARDNCHTRTSSDGRQGTHIWCHPPQQPLVVTTT